MNKYLTTKMSVVLSLAATIPAFSDNSAPRKPNIVLVLADDMGYECLSVNGCLSYNTPFLDNLSRVGIKFNYTISCALCTPSRVEIMTGKYGYRNYTAFEYLDVNERTFGNMLKDAGYATCVVGKWQLNGQNTKFKSGNLMERPLHFGFDEHCLWNVEDEGERYADPLLYENGKKLTGLEDAYGPDVVQKYALNFIERNKEKPFFLYYPMILVHSPFVPTPDSKEWKDKNRRLEKNDKYFKDMVEYTDKLMKELVDKLTDLEIMNNTIFIFTADNGTHYSLTTQTINGPFHGGKGTMPDAGTHAPMIVYNPGTVKQGFEYNELIDFSDFLPTLADIAGIEIPKNIDGKSFYNLLCGNTHTPRETVFVHYDPLKGGGPERWYGRFMRNKEYKLYNDGRFYNVIKDVLELYPISENNLSADQKKIKESFQIELDKLPPHYFKQPSEYKKQKQLTE
ncbi:MAG: sulfatase-like hydrolase/transferase [Bacteroidia bacterium]|nr:sulfatase-like hydrolase/transferase [Bacteroidia bacterium]